MSRLLPDSFIPFLESLSFKAAETGSFTVELWPNTPSINAHNERSDKAAVALYQNAATQVTLGGFRQKVLRILREADHIANEAVADAILGCAVGAAPSGADRAEFLEQSLAGFRTVDVSHFFVLPNSAISKPVQFDGYHLGELNIPVLKSRCNRAHSDYAQLYEEKLAGSFALQSPEFKHVVIDFLQSANDSERYAKSISWRNLLLNYFERISRLHFQFMWAHLDRTQVIGAPFGANFLDVQNLLSEMGKFAQRITVYLGISREGAGYVVPEGGGIVLNQPGPDSEAYARFIDHRLTYRFSEVGDSELGRTLIACAGFCQQAIRFLESGRADDAVLYATICLEHLFSEKQSTAEAVCTRAAVLTHLRLAESFKDAEKELRKLYDARSGFVHSGESVTPTQAERLIAYARETLRSMLVLHFKPENRSQGFLKKWVKGLDFIVAGFEADRTFDTSFLAESGIFRS